MSEEEKEQPKFFIETAEDLISRLATDGGMHFALFPPFAGLEEPIPVRIVSARYKKFLVCAHILVERGKPETEKTYLVPRELIKEVIGLWGGN